jgi:hypothetical protein
MLSPEGEREEMADSTVFDFVCDKIEQATQMDRLAVRGTVRIALKQAGLEARTVTGQQMSVVLERVLPAELATRGVDGGDGLCTKIKAGLPSVAAGTHVDTPDAVFQRLGGA